MKNIRIKLIAALCAASMLMTMPGMSVYAQDSSHEEINRNYVELPDDVVKADELMEEDFSLEEPEIIEEEEAPNPQEDVAESVDEPLEYNLPADDISIEEVLGADAYSLTVGDGVNASYDPDSGYIYLLSTSGGTLWRDWLEKAEISRSSIKGIRVVRKVASFNFSKVKLPKNSGGLYNYKYYLFGGLENLKEIDIENFDTSNVTDMYAMFKNCKNLTDLDLSSINTSNVTYMADMFNSCAKLTNLNLSGFNTSKVTDMSNMFAGCKRLKSINLSGFNTSKVTYMNGMFWQCEYLTSLNLNGFNTSNVTSMAHMFENCQSLTSLNLSGFNTSKVTDMKEMFSDCEGLTSLNLSGFNTSKVIYMDFMFAGCRNLTSLNLSSFSTPELTNASGMFLGCEKFTTLNLSGFNTSKVTDMCMMFKNCYNLTSLDLSGFNTSKVMHMDEMFKSCISLTTLRLIGFNTSNVTDMSEMFCECEKLKYLDLGSFDMSKAYDWGLLDGCKSLEILITPKSLKETYSSFPYSLYDRNGKKYDELQANTKSMVLGKRKALAASIFTDVRDPSHAYYKAIYWAVEKGITKGYSDGTFGIDRSCTRGEMMMFLWRYAGKPAPNSVSNSPFKDVPKTHTFYNAILWGSQKGITKGYSDGTFGINKSVSRGESMMFLWRLKGKKEPTAVSVSPFKDVPKNHVFYKAILWGYQKKITTGYTSGPKKGTFGINENCTRGQIVTFLYRARNL